MKKTPEEIKKGLECCFSPVEPMQRCEACPYYGSIVCKMRLHTDALAYTQQLEAHDSQVKKALQDNGFQTLEELLQAYNQVKRERDAAVRDIKRLVVLKLKKVCLLCANRNKPICNQCEGLDVFEWRGVPEKEEEHE